MPYKVESAYAAQAALKKRSPAYKKSSGFKMNGSPHKTGVIEGAAPRQRSLEQEPVVNNPNAPIVDPNPPMVDPNAPTPEEVKLGAHTRV